MFGLSFDFLPHYIYSNHRQFLDHERHMERTFDEDVLILMRKGILRFSENDRAIELKAGEYYIQQAGKHQAGNRESDKPNYFFIHFHGTFVKNGDLPMRGHFREDSLRPYIDALEQLGNSAELLEYEKFFYSILSELAKQQHDNTAAESIRAFLVTNFTKPLCLEDISRALFLSDNQIIYAFRQTYGTTPHRYLIEYRLEKAADLLVSTERNVTSIAQDVGFREYSAFFRAFSAKYGISPIDFRKIRDGKFFRPPARERPR